MVSHESAAVLLGADLHPSLRAQLTTVQLTTLDGASARRHPGLFEHRLPLAEDEWLIHDGVPVTSPARTALDLAAVRPTIQSVVTADSVLHQGLATPDELGELIGRRRRRGKSRMVRVATLADARSESPGESISRVSFVGQGLPQPELQYVVGHYRSDFAWPAFRTLGEFDGRIKYTDTDVLWAEKLREDALRADGWEVVRWTWAQITSSPASVANRLRAAFARGVLRAA